MIDVVDVIEQEHRALEAQLETCGPNSDVAVVLQLCADVERHLDAEEAVVYPVVARELPNGPAMAGEGEDEHAEIRQLLTRVRDAADADRRAALVDDLRLSLELHVDAEEAEVLPQVRAVLEPEVVIELAGAFEQATAARHRAGVAR